MKSTRWVTRFFAGASLVLAVGCSEIPEPPPHPYYGPNNYGPNANVSIPNNQAQQLSDALYAHIDGWFRGQKPAQIPVSLLPDGYNTNATNIRLIPESQINRDTQWVTRPAAPINWNSQKGLFPDPNTTYLVNTFLYAPFGTKVIVEGEFPHSRQFSIQPTHAFYPPAYRWGFAGSGEVAFVDADIDPLPGHVNPFRVGANRNATSRSYRVTCTMAKGDPVALDPSAWSIPNFRQAGNHRHCGGMIFRGPWGDPTWVEEHASGGDGAGMFGNGEIWVRYYAPDKSLSPWAGVAKPKITYELPDGRRFYIQADQTQQQTDWDLSGPIPATPAAAPDNAGEGWDKMWGIFRSVAAGVAYANANLLWLAGYGTPEEYTDDLDFGVSHRHRTQNSVMVREPGSTHAANVTYLTRGMCRQSGRVVVVSGTMPTFPKTRNGEATMTAGQLRYWSLTGYNENFDPLVEQSPNNIPGQPVTSIMDDEIVLDASRRYIIVYSSAADRPSNATAANGVTWVNWGPQGCTDWVVRWMNIGPDWSFSYAPHSGNLGWETTWTSGIYNPNKIGLNNRNGFLKQYQPIVSYVTKTQFQGYGTSIFSKLTPY